MSGAAGGERWRSSGRNRGPLTDPSYRSLVVSQSVIDAAVSAPAEPIVSVPVGDACCDLLGLFAGISDGRVGPGRDHPVAAVLALAAAAVVGGVKGYTA